MSIAPDAYKKLRLLGEQRFKQAIGLTRNLFDISQGALVEHLESLAILRMCTCPPLAKDRLADIAGVSEELLRSLEEPEDSGVFFVRQNNEIDVALHKILLTINEMIDHDIFPWLAQNRKPEEDELARASSIVADRFCRIEGILSDTMS